MGLRKNTSLCLVSLPSNNFNDNPATSALMYCRLFWLGEEGETLLTFGAIILFVLLCEFVLPKWFCLIHNNLNKIYGKTYYSPYIFRLTILVIQMVSTVVLTAIKIIHINIQ